MDLTALLLEKADSSYADFQAGLTPGISRASIIGVRMPELRRLAHKIKDSETSIAFLNSLPHSYFDENLLHSILLAQMSDFESCILFIEDFLPYIDNWAVCDTLSPKSFRKNKDAVIKRTQKWLDSEHTYTCRFGIKNLMTFFLEDDFKEDYLRLVADIHREEYYVRMMQAWYFATALAFQWDATIPYIEKHIPDEWVHNKAIQKARESLRISEEQKIYLKSLKTGAGK